MRALPYRPIETWQLWNEPNLSSFYRPAVDPTGYGLLVQAGAAGVRSEDPDAVVLLAGPHRNPHQSQAHEHEGVPDGALHGPGHRGEL